MQSEFRSKIEGIQRRVRGLIAAGPPAGDRERIGAVLNEAIQAELACVQRYEAHYRVATAAHGEVAAREYLDFAAEERDHAELLAQRVSALGVEPDLSPPADLSDSRALEKLAVEDVVCERMIVATYRDIVDWCREDDPQTASLLRTIIASEEEHVLN